MLATTRREKGKIPLLRQSFAIEFFPPLSALRFTPGRWVGIASLRSAMPCNFLHYFRNRLGNLYFLGWSVSCISAMLRYTIQPDFIHWLLYVMWQECIRIPAWLSYFLGWSVSCISALLRYTIQPDFSYWLL